MKIYLTTAIQLAVMTIALLSVVYHKVKYKRPTEGFLYFMIIALMVELSANFMRFNEISNLWLYNYFMLYSFLFYFWWYQKTLNLRNKVIYGFILLFIVDFIYCIITQDGSISLFSAPWIIGTVGIILCSALYFYKLLNSEEVIHFSNLKEFWITIGLLMFHVAFLPLFLFQNILFANIFEFTLVIMTLNVILYSSITYGFLVQPPSLKNE